MVCFSPRPYRLSARTRPSQGWKRGSIPRRVTNSTIHRGLGYRGEKWLNIGVVININKNYMAKANSAFMKPLSVSADLAAVVGVGPMPRSEVVKALWAYIKKNNLQDATNKRNINADEKLKKVFGGKAVVNMFEMTKLVSKHLS